MKNLWSANFWNFLNSASVAICIVCKPVGNNQPLYSTCKAACNTSLGQDVNVLEYNTLVNAILLRMQYPSKCNALVHAML